MVIMNILKWFTSFDAVKAVILAIVVIVTSWYDLRAEVRENRQDTAAVKATLEAAVKAHEKDDEKEHAAQAIRDTSQDLRATEDRAALRDAIKDLKQEFRSSRR
jgi:hypothetical protein